MAIMILIYSGLFSDHVLDHVFSDHILAGSCIFRSCTGWIMYFQIMYWLHHLFSDHVLAGSCTGWIICFQIMYWLDRFSDHVLVGSFIFRSCTASTWSWPAWREPLGPVMSVWVLLFTHLFLSFFSVCVCIFICVFIYLFCMFRSGWLGAKHYLLSCMFRCLLFICSFSCIF